ncbi:hypothetical protein SAMD00019534_026870, partial [Acytostelium subglobosum LB1]|uniref:hypothetical protein n=1 Tax=Acytostelium subglobosum LB1 TaxID=1410327 RepID=UPI0006449AC5
FTFDDDNDDKAYQSATDPLLPGSTITLKKKSDGSVVDTQVTTATNPSYTFKDVVVGDYCMSASIPAGYNRLTVVNTDNSFNADNSDFCFTLSADTDVNAGFKEKVFTIKGFSYDDANLDKKYQVTDPLLAGSTITLKKKSDGSVIGTQVTTATNPSFSFTSNKAGDYCMSATVPTGYVRLEVTNADNAFNVDGTDFCFTLSADTDVNAGFRKPPRQVSGYAYDDENLDKQRQPSEAFLAGSTITLKKKIDNSVVATQVTTATDPSYRFNNLDDDDYCISASIPTGYLRVDQINSDNAFNIDNSDYCFTLNKDTIINAGFRRPTHGLVGYAFEDDNNDNTFQPTTEPYVAGSTITLKFKNGTVVGTQVTTAKDPSYAFDTLKEAEYCISASIPTGFNRIGVINKDNAFNDAGDDYCFALSTDTFINAGFRRKVFQIKGYAFDDDNLDDTFQTATEPLVAGSTITLKKKSDGTVVSSQVTTATNPSYTFKDVPYNDYCMSASVPTNYNRLGVVNTDNSFNVDGSDFCFTLSADTDINAGFRIKRFAIKGYSFDDFNDDMSFQSATEELVAGSTITLKKKSDGTVVGTQVTTANNPSYSFKDIPVGEYCMSATVPSDYNRLTVVNTDNSFNVDGSDFCFTLSSDTDVNAGFRKKRFEIRGFTFDDDNDDKRFQLATEPYVAGSTITLKRPDGTVVTTQVTTASFPSYSLKDVIVGDYCISASVPPDYNRLSEFNADNAFTDAAPDYCFKLSRDTILNAGFRKKRVVIKGFAFDDDNIDNQFQPLIDHLVAGSTITLKKKSDGSVVDTKVTTATNPSYTFNNVVVGDYCLSASVPNDYTRLSVTNTDNSFDPSGADYCSTISADTDINVGFRIKRSEIKGYVFQDDNTDNTYQSTEPFVAGSIITLKFKNGTVVSTQTSMAANPSYSFIDVPAGDYCMSASIPSTSYLRLDVVNSDNSFNVDGSDFCFTTSGTGKDVNAGFKLKRFQIKGYSFDDANLDDSFQTATDPLVAGSTITLKKKSDGTVVSTQVTTANNPSYSFNDIPVGEYCMSASVPTNYNRLGVVNSDNSFNVDGSDFCFTLSADTDVNAGFRIKRFEIKGYSFDDFNDDKSFQAATEPLVAGSTITLKKKSDSSVVGTQVTTATNPSYSFKDIPVGEYCMSATVPSDYNRLTVVNTDNSFNVDGTDFCFTLLSNTDVNAGFRKKRFEIRGFTFDDDNDDKRFQSATEPYVAGSTITLKRSDGTVVTTQVTTASFPSYSLKDVIVGDYCISASVPPDYNRLSEFNADNAFTDAAPDYCFKLSRDTILNAGFRKKRVVIKGFAFDDDNLDNQFQPSIDHLVAGSTIALKYRNGTVVDTKVTTATNPSYTFNNVVVGDYCLSASVPNDYTRLPVTNSDNAFDPSGADYCSTFSADTDINVGFRIKRSEIKGYVFQDDNADNTYQSTEPFVAGSVIILKHKNGTVVSTQPSTTSNPSYSFKDVPAGDYCMSASIPSTSYLRLDVVNSDNSFNVDNSDFCFTTSGVDKNVNAGFKLKRFKIKGYSFDDANLDDSFQTATDPLVAGSTITLKKKGTVVNTQVTTANNPSYSFNDIPVGDYCMSASVPSNYNRLGVVNTDNSFNVDGSDFCFTLSADTDVNVGFRIKRFEIKGFAFDDFNDDKTFQTATEELVAGSTITLKKKSDGTVVGTQITKATNPSYSFKDIPVGEYCMSATVPSDYNRLTVVNTDNSFNVDNSDFCFTLLSDTDVNAGFRKKRFEIRGFTFDDDNDDKRFQSATEPYVAGSTITLKRSDGTVVTTQVTTASFPSYSLKDVIVGDYCISASVPPDYNRLSEFNADNAFTDAAPDYCFKLSRDTILNAGFRKKRVVIKGFAFDDDNLDNKFQLLIDHLVAGSTITLKFKNGTVVGTQVTTATNPSYTFNNVVVGDYCLSASVPNDYTRLPVTNTDNSFDPSGADFCPTISADTDINVGFRIKRSNIRGFAFQDDNGDNTYQSATEPLVAGSIITLKFKNGTVVSTQTTKATNPSYSFKDVRAGEYCMSASLPSADYLRVGVVNSDNSFKVDGSDYCFTFMGVDMDINAGFKLKRFQIKGYSFDDENLDNNYHASSDPLVAGSTITLKKKDGSVVNTQVTTANNPSYSFNDIPVGDYCMSATVPPTYNRLGVVNTDNAFNVDNSDYCFRLSADTDVNVGFRIKRAQIKGFAFDDMNADNTYQAVTDRLLAGSTITLKKKSDGSVVGTPQVTTAANPSYSFKNVAFGEYCMSASVPAGFNRLTVVNTDNSFKADNTDLCFTLSADTDVNAGFREKVYTIKGFAYDDVNIDNKFQSGTEPLVAGSTITLKNKDGTVVGTQITTVNNPSYSFTGIKARDYCMSATVPAGYQRVGVVNTDNSFKADGTDYCFTLSGDIDVNAGFRKLLKISGFAFQDDNGDNLFQSATEPFVAGSTVSLWTPSGTIVDSKVTQASNPSYSFTNVPPGDYCMSASIPTNYNRIPVVNTDNSFNVNNIRFCFTLSGVDKQVNAGFKLKTFNIKGYSFVDVNQDNQYQPTEPLLAGTTITLKNKAGQIVGTQVTTDKNPGYTFNDVKVGDYCMSASIPNGYAKLPVTNDYNAFDDEGTDFCFTLSADQTANIGLRKLYQVKGFAFLDTNLNNKYESQTDSLVPGSIVILRHKNGTVFGTQGTTATNPSYAFQNVPAGEYCMSTSVPPDYRRLNVTNTDNSFKDNIDVCFTVVDADKIVNIGFKLKSFQIKGYAFDDEDLDNTYETNEPKVAGSTITLKNKAGGVVDTQVTTATDPSYTFKDVPIGDYCMSASVPTVYNRLAVTNRDNAFKADNSDFCFKLSADTDINAGFRIKRFQIKGYAFEDQNGDNILQNTEPFLAGSTITLKKKVGGTVVDTEISVDGYPSYTFANIPAGDYCMSATPPTGFKNLPITNIPNNAFNDTGLDYCFKLSMDQNINAGFVRKKFQIKGFAFDDDNLNNKHENQDPLIAGSTVTLKKKSDASVVGTRVTTSDNPSYTFNDIPYGEYCMSSSIPAGYDRVPVTNSDNAFKTDNSDYCFTLSANTDVNIGFRIKRFTIKGYTFNDYNFDNTFQTATEPNLAGSTIELKKKNGGSRVGTPQVTTATYPSYTLTGIPYGEYCMSASIPTGFVRIPVTNTDNSFKLDNSDFCFTLSADKTVNAGFKRPTYTISGFAFDDEGSDNDRTDEPFLANIDITLKFKNGSLVSTKTTTANDPGYKYDNLLAGEYCMSTTMPTPIQYFERLAVINNDNSFDNTNNFCFTLGADKSVNVGFKRKIFQINGFAWDDVNRDNVFSSPPDYNFGDRLVVITIKRMSNGVTKSLAPTNGGYYFYLPYDDYCMSTTVHPGYRRVQAVNQYNSFDDKNNFCFTLTASKRVDAGFQLQLISP